MYKAENINTDKMLKEINFLFRQAELKHDRIIAEENVRYRQECEDLRQFEKMFHCSNYEKSKENKQNG